MTRSPLSPADAAWFRMDSATNPMVITSMLTLDGPLERGRLDQTVAELVRNDRFRQRVVPWAPGIETPCWEIDPYFDPALHVHRIAVPEPGNDEALADLVSDLVSAALDPTKPLWQVYVVEAIAGGRTAIVARIHHCLGDGIALARLLASIAGIDVSSAAASPSSSLEHGTASVRALHGVAHVRALGKLLFLPADPASPFKAAPSRRKRVAWSRAIAVDGLKRTAHALHATVNDVVLASTTAALRRYALAHGGVKRGLEVRAIVPVFLGGEASGDPLGNHFGLVYVALPLGCQRPDGRVRVIKGRMDDIKASPEAKVAFALLGVAGIGGPAIERTIVDLFTRKASLLVTNVNGPPFPLEIAGRALQTVTVWAPTAGHVALGVTFMSYAGSMRVGVLSDAAIIPDPEAIVAELERDLDALAPQVSESDGPRPQVVHG